MGEVGAALGQAAKAVQQIKTAKDSLTGGLQSQDTSDPGLQDIQTPSASPVPMPDMSGGIVQPPDVSAAQNTSNSPGISLEDLLGMSQPQPQPQVAPTPADNPYTQADNTDPQQVASSITANSNNLGSNNPGEDIVVTGDDFQPQHHEGWLGKVMDTLLMMRGRGTPFKDRKDEENIQDAMNTPFDNPGGINNQQNQAQFVSRLAKIDPNAAVKEMGQFATQNYYNEGSQTRLDNMRDKGLTLLSNMAGTISKSSDPASSYQNLRPLMAKVASQYQIPDDMLSQALPDQYDPDKLGALQKAGISGYDQYRMDYMSDEAARQNKMTDAQIQNMNVDNYLSKQRLVVEQQNSQTERMNADTARQNANKKDNPPVTKSIFHRDGSVAGTMSPDGMTAALIGPDGKAYAFRLRKRGDINSRVRSPADDAALQAAMDKAAGIKP